MNPHAPFRPTLTLVIAALVPAALALAPSAAADEPERAAPEPIEVQVERQVIDTGDGPPTVYELRREGGQTEQRVWMVGPEGERVRMEVEPDGEGGFHWVERTVEGELVRVRPLDEIAEPGEPRIRAVFIGKDAPPIEVDCGDGSEEDCPPGFRFRYDLVDSEGLGARRGYLGVVLTELTPELRGHFGAPREAGVLVARIEEASPAAEAGLAVGDVITAIDGEAVASSFDLRRAVRELETDQRTTLEVVRGGRILALTVTVAERDVPEVDVRRLLWHTPPGAPHLEGHGGPVEPFVYQLDPEAMNEAVVELKERFASPELRRHVIQLRGAESELEKKIAELEKRIFELEAALERETPPGE